MRSRSNSLAIFFCLVYRNAKSGLGFKASGDNKMDELGAKDGLACAIEAGYINHLLIP